MQPVAELDVLVVAAEGRGGVAGVVDQVVPRLGLPVVRVPPRPLGAAIRRIVAGRDRLVHLHPSLRGRALVRDTGLHAVARTRGRVTVVQLHGWDPAVAARLDRDPRPFVYGLGAADAVVVMVAAHAEQLARWGVAPARIHRVANPYDPAAVADVRVGGPPLVLALGRQVPEKRFAAVVEAVADLDVRLVLAGEGPDRPAIVRAIAQCGVSDRVTFTGWLGPAERRWWLARASVLVSASRSEGCPLVVIEALASGVPVVATATGAIGALVGQGGRVVTEPAALAPALREVLGGGVSAASVRERIRATCAPEQVAAAWRGVYEAAVAHHG